MRNNLLELLARRARRLDRGAISVRQATIEMTEMGEKVSYYTLSAFKNNTLREYPVELLISLCDYLDCTVGDLLSVEERPA